MFTKYARFTDRARKVIQLANQEAQRLYHGHIGTGHILLGLIKEGSGVAANVLKNLDINLGKIRQEVEKIVQPAPDLATPGKLPQTALAQRVIDYAIEEARILDHNYVGTEHLLLGLIREEEGVAAKVLRALGLSIETIRKEITKLLGPSTNPSPTVPPRQNRPERFAVLATRWAHQHPLRCIFCGGVLATLYGGVVGWAGVNLVGSDEVALGALAAGVLYVAAVSLTCWVARNR
jgi:ATP-dependent Clp protease ATP-binding subunit ClpA